MSDDWFGSQNDWLIQNGREELKEIGSLLGIDPNLIPPKLQRSPNLFFYADSIRARWSLRQVHKLAREQFHEDIGFGTFHRFSALVPESKKIPKSFVDTDFQGIDVTVNGYIEMQNAVALMKSLVSRLVELQDRMGGIVMPQTVVAVGNLFKMAKDLTDIQMVKGLIKFDGGTNAEVEEETAKIKRVMGSLTDEQKMEFRWLCETLDKNNVGCVLDGADDIEVKEEVNIEIIQAA